MGSKPWITEEGGRRLEAFLGARGLRTSEIATTDELIQTASGVFEIPMQTSCLKMADAIANLPKGARRTLARKNLGAAKSRSGAAAPTRLSELAAELGIDSVDLGTVLKQLVHQKIASECATKSLSQRAKEAEAKWLKK